MYTVERANGDTDRSIRERGALDCEVIERGVSGVPRVVCLASMEDAVKIAALLNMDQRRVPRTVTQDEMDDCYGQGSSVLKRSDDTSVG